MKSRLTKRRSPALVLGILGSAAILGLSACGNEPGAAVVADDFRFSDAQLAADAQEIQSALGIPASADLNRAILSREISTVLVDDLATEMGLTVTQGDIDRKISEYVSQLGSREQLDQAAIRSAITPEALPAAIRQELQVNLLTQVMAGGKDTTKDPQAAQAGQELVLAKLKELSNEQDVRVSPRFGTWNVDEFKVEKPADDLSVPDPSFQPQGQLPGMLPQQQ